MTAPAVFRQSDLRRLTEMAKESGCVIEMEKDGVKIRVMPDTPNIHSATAVDPSPSPASNGLAAWRARHEGKSRGSSSR
jgi:hydrogenase maturation factor